MKRESSVGFKVSGVPTLSLVTGSDHFVLPPTIGRSDVGSCRRHSYTGEWLSVYQRPLPFDSGGAPGYSYVRRVVLVSPGACLLSCPCLPGSSWDVWSSFGYGASQVVFGTSMMKGQAQGWSVGGGGNSYKLGHSVYFYVIYFDSSRKAALPFSV